jgi:hypothetical protein
MTKREPRECDVLLLSIAAAGNIRPAPPSATVAPWRHQENNIKKRRAGTKHSVLLPGAHAAEAAALRPASGGLARAALRRKGSTRAAARGGARRAVSWPCDLSAVPRTADPVGVDGAPPLGPQVSSERQMVGGRHL